jgi:glucose-1-phosphate cytidylyltransferase
MDAIDDVVILCGGRGTRLREHTRSIPKPLVEIGGEPIVGHVVRIYAAQGFHRFHLLTGYKGELIESYVAGAAWPEGVEVLCHDTGVDTPTGGRIARIAETFADRPVCATYADGVADIDLRALVEFHAEHGDLATMTVVQPTLQFGIADLNGEDRVRGFIEKPKSERWINGGFFCFEPAALTYPAADSILEREPLERLAAEGQLHGFRHSGFWECMDTYKDAVMLNDLWARGDAPWKAWG